MLTSSAHYISCFNLLYAFRCSRCGASTPHSSDAHTCTHVCSNAMCQTHTPTNTLTHILCMEKCFHSLSHWEKLQRVDLVEPLGFTSRERDSLSDSKQYERLLKPNSFESVVWKKRETEIEYWMRERDRNYETNSKQRDKWDISSNICFCGENRGFAEGLSKALLLTSSTCF